MEDDEFARLAEKLDMRRKVRLLTGATTWRTRAEPAVGLRAMTASDGPAGVRGEAWDERITSRVLPSPSALAATWDEPLVAELGRLLAAEARAKGVRLLLAPTLNLHRSPLGGRHFECFSEDPLLTGRIGAALIRAVQSCGVAATAKHFVANDAESERLTVDVRVDERTLREVYLAPFETAVEAGVWLVMSAYNGVNGAQMSANPLLTSPLKSEWGFDGAVISDWGAVRTTEDTAAGGLDLVMPGPAGPWGDALLRAVRDGLVPEEAVDDKVRRLLKLAHRTGALGSRQRRAPAAPSAARARALLRRAAGASTVLLRNAGLLPLDPGSVRTLAVVGGHALAPRVQGGGSAEVFPDRTVSPLDGIRAALPPGVALVHAAGPALEAPPPPLTPGVARNPRSGVPGVLVRVLDAEDHELEAEHRLSGRILEPSLPPGAHTVEISALVCPETGGTWEFGLAGFGRMSLTVDGKPLIDGYFPRETDDPTTVHVKPPAVYGSHTLAAGDEVAVVARRGLAEDTGRAVILSAAPQPPDGDDALAGAVAAVRSADAAIVVVGTTDDSESEGRDRAGLELPGRQDELVRAVIAAQPRTVVCVNAGGPVEMPWHTEAQALLLSWFPGGEGGHALADVLFGAVEPGGRLPTTWGGDLADVPVRTTVPTRGVLTYQEGVHIGHRAWLRHDRRPAYWFGHGLGYTTWGYERMYLPVSVAEGAGFEVRVRVRNTGGRAGREVVQVYLARPGSEVDRPVRWLAGYAAVEAEPGETTTAVVRVAARAVQHWDGAGSGWRTERGGFTVLAARSAGDVRLRGEVTVLGEGAPGSL